MGLAGALALAAHGLVLLGLAIHHFTLATHSRVLLVLHVLLGLVSRLVLVVMSHFILRQEIIFFTHQEELCRGSRRTRTSLQFQFSVHPIVQNRKINRLEPGLALRPIVMRLVSLKGDIFPIRAIRMAVFLG